MCGKGSSTAIVYNEISKHFNIDGVIVEEDVNKSNFIKRRIKKLGFLTVVGQIFFKILILPFLKSASKKRKKQILDDYGLNTDENYLNNENCVVVSSINCDECIDTLRRINPDIVVVNGTKIISEKVLTSVNATFINMHCGITPKYRGVHGAYWALCNKDYDNAGVTVHLVDKGIDTGGVIYQSKIEITNKDNFCTYPLLQTAVGVKLELQAIEDFINGKLKTIDNGLPSRLYSHPTIVQYLYYRIKNRVK